MTKQARSVASEELAEQLGIAGSALEFLVPYNVWSKAGYTYVNKDPSCVD